MAATEMSVSNHLNICKADADVTASHLLWLYFSMYKALHQRLSFVQAFSTQKLDSFELCGPKK